MQQDPAQIAVIFDALPFPSAAFTSGGVLVYANPTFNQLWTRLMQSDGLSACTHMDQVLAAVDLPMDNAGSGQFHDYCSATGIIASFAINPTADGGWIISAQDVTKQRNNERRAVRTQKIALVALADLAEHRDTETGEHVLRVARLTHEIARKLRAMGHYPEIIDDDFLRHVGVASILHDVGKVSIPDSVLLKPGKLTPEERAVMERHAANGGSILRKAATMLTGSTQFNLAAEIAEYHHERWEGGGYPHGLSGHAIPLSARIVSAADVFDALMSNRPYKTPWPQEAVLAHLRDHAGRMFDPLVVDALVEVIESRSRAKTIEWTPEMTVREESLDHDHRILLALVNQISIPENKGDPTAVEFVLDELLGYTIQHFTREEKLMEEAGYNDLAEHKRIHTAMIDQVRDLQRRMAAFTPRLGDELHRFLGNWLTDHILGEDQCYIPSMVAHFGQREEEEHQPIPFPQRRRLTQ